jgi:hypothetical protein
MKKFRDASWTSVLLAGALIGCGRDQPDIVGRYRLVGSTRDTLPLVAQQDVNCVHTVRQGVLVLERDSTYSSSFTIMEDCTGMTKPVVKDPGIKGARYSVRGDTIVMRSGRGRVSGIALRRGTDTLVVQGPQHTLVYVRR